MLDNSIKDKFRTNLYFYAGYCIILIVCSILYFTTPNDFVFFKINYLRTIFLDWLNVMLTMYGQGEYIFIFLLYLLAIPYFRTKKYLFTVLVFTILIVSMNYMLKSAFFSPRPLLVYDAHDIMLVDNMPKSYNYSFPSGHTSAAFAMFTMLLFLLPSKLNYKWLQILFLILACGTAYSRMYLGQHFFEDVIAGSLLGILIGTAVGLISEKLFPTKN